MAKAPLTSLQRHRRAVMLMEVGLQLREPHTKTCWRYVEFEHLCQRYAGNPADLDPLIDAAKRVMAEAIMSFWHLFAASAQRRLSEEVDEG